MALIYTKLTDKTTVLAPREGACRKFNFGTDWTEVRLGGFFTAVAATGSNDDNVNETLAVSSIADRITLGLKDDSQTYPGQAGSLFIGVRSGESDVKSYGPSSGFGSSSSVFRAVGYYGATEVLAAASPAGGTIGAAAASGATSYAAFMCIKININDRGLSTQNIDVRTSYTSPVTGADYSATALRTALNNASFGGAGNFAWNDGAAARAIPDCVWVRVPLFSNQLRISAIRAIRYAP